jgi:serine/threonine protein kinase
VLDPDTILNDRYRLIEPIGEGGMATVYRALDTRLGRTVAIKILHPEYSRDRPFIQRFQQEAEFAASLGAHPNIVAIYDIGEDGRLHFIVMELIDGRTLKDLIRERAPFAVAEAFGIGSQVASALDFAHKRGLVHRDVKPQNIMVTSDGTAKVTDFGIAQSAAASQLTRTGMVIGTVHYFSPEQAQGKPATPASDIYSLGIILYEMLTAHLPFDAENAVGVAMQHIQSTPPSPWDYNSALPARAVGTFMRALEKDPRNRYRDAAEFAAALAAPVAVDSGGTTTVNPIISEATRQATAMYRPVEPVARRPAVVRETVAPRPAPTTRVTSPPNPWRNTWLALGGLLAVLAIAAIGFFAANQIFAGGATSTPTPTPTAKPSPTATHVRRKPTPIPPTTAPVALPTEPPPVQPTVPPATSTPRPVISTPTPKPVPQATATSPPPPQPTPAPTVEILGPTPTPTPVG